MSDACVQRIDSNDALRLEAVRILHGIFKSHHGCQLDLLTVFKACLMKASSIVEQRQQAEKKAQAEAIATKVKEAQARAAAADATIAAKAKEAQTRAAAADAKQRELAIAAESKRRLGEEAAKAVEPAQARQTEVELGPTPSVEKLRQHAIEKLSSSNRAALSWHHSVIVSTSDKAAESAEPFVTKKAMKKARIEAVKAAEAEQEANRLQRKEAKKERRQAEAAAKVQAEVATREAEVARRASTRIQCAVRRRLAHCRRAELHRRKVQRKCFAVTRAWRHIFGRILRDVQGLSLLLQAANAKLGSSPPALAEISKTRPNSLKTALEAGNWTPLRDSNHHVFKRKVVTSEGVLKTQFTTLAKTPSDFRSNPNSLAKLRGKLEDGIVQ